MHPAQRLGLMTALLPAQGRMSVSVPVQCLVRVPVLLLLALVLVPLQRLISGLLPALLPAQLPMMLPVPAWLPKLTLILTLILIMWSVSGTARNYRCCRRRQPVPGLAARLPNVREDAIHAP